MAVVYHGTYLRYMEHARVEFMRRLGMVYAKMERGGFGLPVVDLGVSYLAPARYDDVISVYVGVQRLGMARLDFAYELVVEPEDRFVGEGETPLAERVVLLHGETKHACTSLADGSVQRLPEELHAAISGYLEDPSLLDGR
jgi:acyl-CoA thioester hydrolase